MSPQRLAGLAFLCLSTVYAALAASIEETFDSSALGVGPRAFPLFVGAAGVVLSFVLLLQRGHAVGAAESSLAGDWRRALALCALTLLYAAALPWIGFALATAAFLAAAFRLLGERRSTVLAAVPIAVAVVSLVALRGALGVHLPEPLLETVWARLSSP